MEPENIVASNVPEGVTPLATFEVLEHGDVTAYWTVSSINGEFAEWLQLTFAA